MVHWDGEVLRWVGVAELAGCLQEKENTDETETDKWCVRRREKRGGTGSQGWMTEGRGR